eukprot:58550-Amphidinium_carterae.2
MEASSPLGGMLRERQEIMYEEALADMKGLSLITLPVKLASRADICGFRWQMDRRQCMEAVVERLVWLLYPNALSQKTHDVAGCKSVVEQNLAGGNVLWSMSPSTQCSTCAAREDLLFLALRLWFTNSGHGCGSAAQHKRARLRLQQCCSVGVGAAV